jgi:hypothetical protein
VKFIFSNGLRVYFSRASGLVDALHSTPSHYFAAVEEERRVLSSRPIPPPPLAVVRGGFMPYCDGIGDPHVFCFIRIRVLLLSLLLLLL